MNKNRISFIALSFIVFLAAFLRFYKLSEIPPAISWDEASVGYNAWSILKFGRDEWGIRFPLSFKAFEEFKLPINVYLTAISIFFFGLNELGVRASAAFFGVLNVFLIFFLAKKMFKSNILALFAALFLALSPYNLQFSRFNHELNFAIFFFMLGVFFVLKGLEKNPKFLILGFASFGLDLLTYNAAKIVVPAIVFTIVVANLKVLLKFKKQFIYSIVVFCFFLLLIFLDSGLLGVERFKQVSSLSNGLSIESFNQMATSYFSHFQPKYLFLSGDPNPRHSIQSVGILYRSDIVFLTVGFFALTLKLFKKSKAAALLLAWVLLAVVPASLGAETPHSGRAMFMTGGLHIILALGAYTIIDLSSKRWLRAVFASVIVLVTVFFTGEYLRDYYKNYSEKFAIEWQYGMAEIVKHISENPEYVQVYMTPERQQPYIFFLFYLNYPLPEFYDSVLYNETKSRSSNLVLGFDKYRFGGWDPIESKPFNDILYIVTPSQFNGLRHKALFKTVKSIYYPNGTEAFHLVTHDENE